MKPSTYAPITAGGFAATAHQRGSSSSTSDVKTITLNQTTSAILVTVETTSARVTIDGSDPSAASAPSTIFPKDLAPVLVPVGASCVVKWVSTAAAASVLQITELA